MSDDFIMQMRPWFGQEEKAALNEYMEEDGFLTEFKKTELFEDLIAKYTGARHCIVVNNGTSSLTLAAIATGVKAGEEVIVPNYTMIASATSMSMIGAKPIFVDVEPDTLCMDFSKIQDSITPKTKALILVSANGRFPSYDIQKLVSLCEENNIALIEDAAQALGSYYPDNTHIGLKGLVGSISFSAPKIISTGQGGALITDCDDLADRIRRLKDFGRSSGGSDIHDTVGFNFKFTELQAVVGIEQIKKLDFRVERKKEIYQRYMYNLRSVSEVKFFEHNFNFTTPWFIDCTAVNRDALQVYLKSKNVGTRVMYPPLTSQKPYFSTGDYSVASYIGKNGLWLPSMSQLSDDDIDLICNEICCFYQLGN